MKSIHWTDHALENLSDREIDKEEAEKAIRKPELTVSDPPGREIRMRRYYDTLLGKEMLLRVVIAEMPTEVVVITIYKSSQISRYLRGSSQ